MIKDTIYLELNITGYKQSPDNNNKLLIFV